MTRHPMLPIDQHAHREMNRISFRARRLEKFATRMMSDMPAHCRFWHDRTMAYTRHYQRGRRWQPRPTRVLWCNPDPSNIGFEEITAKEPQP